LQTRLVLDRQELSADKSETGFNGKAAVGEILAIPSDGGSGGRPGAFGAGSPIAMNASGSSSDPSLDGNLHYPDDIDRSLNETPATDKIRKYITLMLSITITTIPRTVSFMSVIPSTSGRIHSEFVRLLLYQ
jgi:hypothetical protein